MSEKTKVRIHSGRIGVILSLFVFASLEIWLLVHMEAIGHTKTLCSNFHPYRYPL